MGLENEVIFPILTFLHTQWEQWFSSLLEAVLTIFVQTVKIVKKICVLSYIVADKNKLIPRNVYDDIHISRDYLEYKVLSRLRLEWNNEFSKCSNPSQCGTTLSTSLLVNLMLFLDLILF